MIPVVPQSNGSMFGPEKRTETNTEGNSEGMKTWNTLMKTCKQRNLHQFALTHHHVHARNLSTSNLPVNWKQQQG